MKQEHTKLLIGGVKRSLGEGGVSKILVALQEESAVWSEHSQKVQEEVHSKV